MQFNKIFERYVHRYKNTILFFVQTAVNSNIGPPDMAQTGTMDNTSSLAQKRDVGPQTSGTMDETSKSCSGTTKPTDAKMPRLCPELDNVAWLEQRVNFLEKESIRQNRWIAKHHLIFNGNSLLEALARQQPGSDLSQIIKDLANKKWNLVLPVEDIGKHPFVFTANFPTFVASVPAMRSKNPGNFTKKKHLSVSILFNDIFRWDDV